MCHKINWSDIWKTVKIIDHLSGTFLMTIKIYNSLQTLPNVHFLFLTTVAESSKKYI